jgi:hypothetical protein
MIISLALIGIANWLFKINYPKISEMLKEKLLSSLNRSSDDDSRQPLYDIFYEDAIKGLVSIDPETAAKFLLAEISNAHSILDSDSLKKSIVTALATLTDIDQLTFIMKKIVVDPNNSIFIKSYVFKLMKEVDQDKAFELVVDVLKAMVHREEKDFQVFDYCFATLLNDFASRDTEQLRLMVIDLIQNQYWGTNAVKLIAEALQSPSFELNEDFIFDLLYGVEDKDKVILKNSLSKRQQLSEEEITIMDDVEKVSEIQKESILPTEIIHCDKDGKDLGIPEFLQDDFEKFKASFEKKFSKPGIRLLIGDSEIEKYYLLKAIMAKTSRTLIYIDVKQIVLSPVRLDDLESIINASKPCVLYLADVSEFFKLLKNEPGKRELKFINILKKYFNDSRVSLYASIPMESIDIRTNEVELFEFINDTKNTYISEQISICEMTAGQKQKIFNNYEMKIGEQREVALEGFDVVLDSTKDFSKVKYLDFLLNYMQSSLLSKGELMPLHNYKSALQKIISKKQELIEL